MQVHCYHRSLSIQLAMLFLFGIELVLSAAVFSFCSVGAETGTRVKLAKPPERWDDLVVNTFFPDARLVLVGPPQATASSNPGGKEASSTHPSANPPVAPKNGNSQNSTDFHWSAIISAETLQDEIK